MMFGSYTARNVLSMQGIMKNILLTLMVFGIVGCSMPQEEKENIAAVT